MAAIPPIVLISGDAEIARLSLKPGDVLGIFIDGYWSPDHKAYIRASFREVWPDNEVVIFEGGAKLGIVSRDAQPGESVEPDFTLEQ